MEVRTFSPRGYLRTTTRYTLSYQLYQSSFPTFYFYYFFLYSFFAFAPFFYDFPSFLFLLDFGIHKLLSILEMSIVEFLLTWMQNTNKILFRKDTIIYIIQNAVY